MSQTETQTGDAQPDNDDTEQVEKEVTVIGYATPDAFADERAFADELTETDMYERETTESVSVEIGFDDQTEGLYHSDLKEAVADAVETDRIDTGDFEVDVERNFSKDFSNSLTKAMSELRSELLDDAPDELPGEIERGGIYDYKWQDDMFESFVHVMTGSIDERPLLAHRSRRTADERYDDEEDRLSVSFTVDMGPADADRIDEWSEAVVGTLSSALGQVSAIERVRIASCTERVERQGDCFDI